MRPTPLFHLGDYCLLEDVLNYDRPFEHPLHWTQMKENVKAPDPFRSKVAVVTPMYCSFIPFIIIPAVCRLNASRSKIVAVHAGMPLNAVENCI
jgi:hypothetical protein